MQHPQTFRLKGMVCNRCITLLKSSLESLSVSVEKVSLGELTVSGLESPGGYSRLEQTLATLDFVIVEDRNRKLVREVKAIIRSFLSDPDLKGSRVRVPELLSGKLNMSYDTIRDVFAELEGMTIASYVIHQRVEKVKEYVLYTDLPLTEVAFLTGYSSVFHLSGQFKEVTAQSPARFRQVNRPLARA